MLLSILRTIENALYSAGSFFEDWADGIDLELRGALRQALKEQPDSILTHPDSITATHTDGPEINITIGDDYPYGPVSVCGVQP